ncbi:septum site-determining protein MinC [Paenibacillus swuensis]|uniref:Probable septum site-determining protein MinC n=1 Tax=Paenibacillus swuensis TaxID=1178515 RepID=A0A172TPI0_9BACL|nr:septum site-determining protein MinC [Paenibacillus swuensis]ANE48920.1 septum site-determining protein MinC [Paenibacillus swuensis]
MIASKHLVTIKGVKDGLIFLLNDECEFSSLLEELNHKLENTHQKFLSGPIIHVHVKLGKRVVDEEQETLIRESIRQRGNLLIQSIESDLPEKERDPSEPSRSLKIMSGMVRSGQSIHYDGNLMYMGDINPGGTITSTGDIYVMGSLRGLAHAGIAGNRRAVIAASYLKPTQLRIAEIISRPPDEWEVSDASMEFAYLNEQKMEIDKIVHLGRIRPDAVEFKGE